LMYLSSKTFIYIFHAILLTLGTILSPDPSNKSGLILASCLLCYLFCFSYISFCICNSSFLCIFIIIFSTTTIEPNIIPPKIAFLNATRAPERKASNPPVTAPAMIWFHESSFLRRPINAQSVAEKRPAQIAKLPRYQIKYLQE